jgi:hypothetical protein
MISQIMESTVAEQATGCRWAGDYRQVALENGYPYLEVYDWTSSAGDWTFIVSKDGLLWRVMWQENNWPRRGFTYTFSDEEYEGDAKAVLQLLYCESTGEWPDEEEE